MNLKLKINREEKMLKNCFTCSFILMVFIAFMTPGFSQEWLVYDASVMPDSSDPAFITSNSNNPPDTSTWIEDDPDIVGNSLARYVCPDADSRIMWAIDPIADSLPNGITFMFRVKAYDYGSYNRIFELDIRPGVLTADSVREKVVLHAANRIQLENSNVNNYDVTGIENWHTYRVTYYDSVTTVYMDENPAAVVTGQSADNNTNDYFRWGDGSGSNTYGCLLDWFAWDTTGVYAPGEGAAIPDSLYVDEEPPIPPPPGWLVYDASVMPDENDPAFDVSNTLNPPDTSTWIEEDPDIVGNSLARFVCPDADSRTMWRINNMGYNNENGATFIFRVKAYDFGTYNVLFELDIRTGGVREKVVLQANGEVELQRSGQDVVIDSIENWHTYRVTYIDSVATVYLDENPTPLLSGFNDEATTSDYFRWGDGSDGNTYACLVDWFIWDTTGANAPGEGMAIPDSLYVDEWEPEPIPPSWLVYDASVMPDENVPPFGISNTSNPPDTSTWIVEDPDIEGNSLARFICPDADSRTMWAIDPMGYIPAFGATFIFRVKAYEFGSYDCLFELDIRTGGVREKVVLQANGEVELQRSGHDTSIEGIENWHTYRVTYYNSETNVYLDENATPLLTGITSETNANDYFRWGDGSDGNIYACLVDWIIWDTTGAYAPGQGLSIPDSLHVDSLQVEELALVAYWKLDETSGTTVTDSLGNSIGTLVNMEGNEWTTGQVDNALDFAAGNDSSHILIADNDFIEFGQTESFTISVIVKADPLMNTDDMYMVYKGASEVNAGNGWEGKWYGLSFKDQQARFAVDDNVNKTELAVSLTGLDNPFPVNQWIHLVAVRDLPSDSLRMYLNGVQIGVMKDITDNDISSGDLPLLIGNDYTLQSRFIGQMDEVRIYQGALPGSEIQDLFESYEIHISGINNGTGKLPLAYALYQNYPNPFNPATTIKFDLLKAGNTNIKVYNTLGQLVETLLDKKMEAGYHKVIFNAGKYASGVYFYKIVSGKFIEIKKMVLIK
jgi:hypothetical protein